MTSPDSTPVLHNAEGHAEFDVAWPWVDQVLTPGITTVLRVKNESRLLPRVLPGVLSATDRVVLVDNQSDDGTAAVAREVADLLGASDRLTVREYPFDVSRCGEEHLWTPDRSVHSLAYFYNWSFSHASTSYSMKWDGDMVLTPEGVAVVRDLGWLLPDNVVVAIPRHGLFVESDNVAYLDRGTANIEKYVFPMAPGYGHVKSFEWELRMHPEDITLVRLPDGLCVELKYLDSDEFSQWTTPGSFAQSTRTERKRREWDVFHRLREGDANIDDVVRIEAPPGVNVIDFVAQTWLPQSARPVHAKARPIIVSPDELTIAPQPGQASSRAVGGDASGGANTNAEEVAPAETVEADRRVLLVAGSGRSGTSLFSGIVSQLGMHVPQPEISKDDSNPRGFSESAWAVAFHNRLLARGNIEVSDARPQAWFSANRLSLLPRPRQLLFEWLKSQFAHGDELVIKDPRLSWFLGMWRAAALRTGARPGFATMLRHPTDVVSSKSQRYPGPAGNINRTAGWINMMLFTERATRGSDRAFVRYDDLLEDWKRVVPVVGESLGLRAVTDATGDAINRVDEFVTPSLRGSHGDWEALGVSGVIRDLAEETWVQLHPLADPGEDNPTRAAALDALRRDYTALYAEAEGIVASSIDAAKPAPPPSDGFLVELDRTSSGGRGR